MMDPESSPHSKSMSPVKEVVWRQSPSARSRNNVQRRVSEIYPQRQYSSFLDDSGESGIQTSPFSSPLSARRGYYQKQRQNSSTLQDFHMEQAELLRQRKEHSRSNCGVPNQPPPAPSSFYSYDAPRNRYSALELSMHSTDSLTSNGDRRSSGSAKQQEQPPMNHLSQQYSNQMQYAPSPPRSTVGMDYHGQQQMSSPILARREMSNPPQPQPVPYQPQMLVDPNTGQHYIFPQAPQPQYFYPMMPAPVYYTPNGVQPGYIVASQPQQMPQPPQSPTRSRAVFYHPQQQQQPQQHYGNSYNNGYFVEPPPSSNVSVCGMPQETDYFGGRRQGSRQSLESGSNSSSRTTENEGKLERTRKDSRDSMSPAQQQQQPQQQATVEQIQNQMTFAQLSTPTENNHPGKYSTTSSCTSGFASATTDSTIDPGPFNTSFVSNKTRPAWWGASEASTRIGIEGETANKTSPTHRALSENRSLNSTGPAAPNPEDKDEKTPTQVETAAAPALAVQAQPEEAKKPVQRAIRMDIDLNAPVSPSSPEKKPLGVGRTASTAATSFTVAFDEEKKPLSLQDAVKQAPRRFMRRSAPAKPIQPPTTDSESEHQDPKHYLFNKMIQGVKKGQNAADLESIQHARESDTLSEAGTYIVDTKGRMNESQLLGSEDESSSGDETESTFSKPSTSSKDPPEPNPARSLLAQRLEELRMRSSTPISIHVKAVAAATNKEAPPTKICQRQAHTAPSANNNNFRRGDGGRFSMRTTTSTAAVAASRPKPPFKTGPAQPKKVLPTPPQKDTPEMVAWLRRKEYDPRKSAAEAKKIQQLKARETVFQQNRSVSFHPIGNTKPFLTARDLRKSHDDLSHVAEDEEMPQDNELTKQVDALTQKCLKSIQLIKVCNQNTLSESVENLLDNVVSLDDEPQTTTEQLKRLSSAFDAIQKYFEEQRSRSVSPPVFRRMASSPGESTTPRSAPIPTTAPPSGSRHIPPKEGK